MHQCEIIKYFNMRYECLDARDDYSARHHLLESKNVIPQWTVDHANGEADDDQFYEGKEFQVDSHLLDEEYEHIGKEGERVIRQMMEMDEIIKNSGWLDKSHDGLPTVNLSVVEPETRTIKYVPWRNGRDWKISSDKGFDNIFPKKK